MFIYTQFEKVVNIAQFLNIKVDYSIQDMDTHGRSIGSVHHRIWVEHSNKQLNETLAYWNAENEPEKTAKLATAAFDEIFFQLQAGKTTFNLKEFIFHAEHRGVDKR